MHASCFVASSVITYGGNGDEVVYSMQWIKEHGLYSGRAIKDDNRAQFRTACRRKRCFEWPIYRKNLILDQPAVLQSTD